MNDTGTENPILSVSKVSKSFGHGENLNRVLKEISFEVKKGEFVSVMGPSGCGKSTLLYLIGGLDKPDSGKIELCKKDIATLNDNELSTLRRREIGFVFQFYNLVPNLTVEENIMLPVIMDGQHTGKYSEEIDSILQIVGLTDKKKAYPSELSGGQQQRTAISRALIMKPKLLLADEPTGNLDFKSGQDVIRLFREINRDFGITVLQVTHSEKMAECGSRIITMQDGIIEKDYVL